MSFGGIVSLKFSLLYKYKISKLVLISSNYNLNKIRKRTKLAGLLYIPIAEFITFLSKPIKEKRKPYIDYSTIKGPFFSLKYGIKSAINNSLKTQALRYKIMKNSMSLHIEKKELENLDAPLLVIYGENDFFFNRNTQKELLKSVGESRIKMLKKAGHNIYIEKPKEASLQIKKFLNE